MKGEGRSGCFCGLDNVHICLRSDEIMRGLVFVLIYHDGRVALPDVAVLKHCSCSPGECWAIA